MWQLINTEIGNPRYKSCNIKVRNGSGIILNPQRVLEMFNSYFVETVEDLKTRNKSYNVKHSLSHSIEYNQNNSFVLPATDCEAECIINSLKGPLAGYDEIPESVIRCSSHHVKKPLAHTALTYNSSYQTRIFPDMLKIAKIRPVFKSGDKQDIQNYRPISVLRVFLNYWTD
jgi:hypothetical protein